MLPSNVADYAKQVQQGGTLAPALMRDLTGPDRAICAIYARDAAQVFNNGVATVVDYNIPIVAHAAVTTGAAWKFTCPATMFYLVACSLALDATTAWALTEVYRTGVLLNGTLYRILHREDTLISSGSSIIAHSGARMTIIPGKVGETISIEAYQTSAANLNCLNGGNAAQHNWVAIYGIKGF